MPVENPGLSGDKIKGIPLHPVSGDWHLVSRFNLYKSRSILKVDTNAKMFAYEDSELPANFFSNSIRRSVASWICAICSASRWRYLPISVR